MNDSLQKRIMKNTYSSLLRGIRSVLLIVLCTLGLGLSANATTITTFDAPGAGTAAGQGTIGSGTSPIRAMTGFIRDANSARHGILRAPGGTFTTFNATGARTLS